MPDEAKLLSSFKSQVRLIHSLNALGQEKDRSIQRRFWSNETPTSSNPTVLDGDMKNITGGWSHCWLACEVSQIKIPQI